MSKLANMFSLLHVDGEDDGEDDREEVTQTSSTSIEETAASKPGLDILKDRILEIACIITDGKLTKQIEGPDLVISQSKDCLDNMVEWCKTHHASSGARLPHEACRFRHSINSWEFCLRGFTISEEVYATSCSHILSHNC